MLTQADLLRGWRAKSRRYPLKRCLKVIWLLWGWKANQSEKSVDCRGGWRSHLTKQNGQFQNQFNAIQETNCLRDTERRNVGFPPQKESGLLAQYIFPTAENILGKNLTKRRTKCKQGNRSIRLQIQQTVENLTRALHWWLKMNFSPIML